jgi:hypothetical protein
LATERFHVRPSPGTCTRNNIRTTIAVHIARGDIHATPEGGIVSEETHDCIGCSVEDLGTIEHNDLRSTAGSRSHDKVCNAVTVNIAHGYANTAAECRTERL